MIVGMGSLDEHLNAAQEYFQTKHLQENDARARMISVLAMRRAALPRLKYAMASDITRFLAAMRRHGNPGSVKCGFLSRSRFWQLTVGATTELIDAPSDPWPPDAYDVGLSTDGELVWCGTRAIITDDDGFKLWIPTEDDIRQGMARVLTENNVSLHY